MPVRFQSIMPSSTRNKSTTEQEKTLTLSSLKGILDGYFNPLNDKISGITRSLNKIEQQVKDIEIEQVDQAKAILFLGDEVEHIKQSVDSVKAELKETTIKTGEIDVLKSSISKMEFERRAKFVEINGIPPRKGEDLMEALKILVTKLEVAVSPVDNDTVYRIKTTKRVVIRFQSTHKRDLFFKAFRGTNICGNDLGFQTTEKIYINEVLSPEQHQLLYKARKARKDKNYAHIWTFHQRIYMKKTSDSDMIEIKSEEGLKNLP